MTPIEALEHWIKNQKSQEDKIEASFKLLNLMPEMILVAKASKLVCMDVFIHEELSEALRRLEVAIERELR